MRKNFTINTICKPNLDMPMHMKRSCIGVSFLLLTNSLQLMIIRNPFTVIPVINSADMRIT